MANKPLDLYDIIKQLRNEALKEYREYDEYFRPSAIYQAYAEATNGEPCLKTAYVYDGPSNRIKKKQESIVPWDSSWDI